MNYEYIVTYYKVLRLLEIKPAEDAFLVIFKEISPFFEICKTPNNIEISLF